MQSSMGLTRRDTNLWRVVGLLAVLLSVSHTVIAQPGTVRLTAQWSSRGQLYQVAPENWAFQGHLEGRLFLEELEGPEPFFDQADLVCPVRLLIDPTSRDLQGNGYCIFQVENDIVFGAFSCRGQKGQCHGTFTLSGGAGQRAGIYGEGQMLLRVTTKDMLPFGSLRSLGVHGMHTSLEGFVEWPELSYAFRDPNAP
ncbi:MAG: hypothetical protein ACFCBW_14990 [Candidatus Competibacterales bacterium]